LVGRFVAGRDEAAFAEIVRRHGPTVLGLCRRVTGDHHLAEDAFQAVFVVLAAKAGCIRPRSAVAAWLYGVAYRTALRARTMADRRRRREAPVGTLPEPPAPATDPAGDADLSAVLEAEVAALPEALRSVVVLCELEGKPRKDAARELGIPEGTLSSRLAAARKALAGRLRGRGVALGAAGLTVALARLAPAAVPAPLAARAAAALTPGLVPAPVAVLSRGVMRVMFLNKLKTVAPLVAVALGGVLTWAVFAPAAPPGSPQPARLPTVVVPGVLIRPAAKADPKPLPKGPNKLLVWRKGELVMFDPDGTNEKTVVAQGEKGGIHSLMFSLSPDGTKVAVVAPPPGQDDNQREFQAHLFVRELGKDGPGNDLGPAGMARWSGDGAELFVCQFADGQQPKDVRATHFILNLATKERTSIKLPENHIMTDGSRDGRLFLTVKLGTDRDNPVGGIFVMNRDGSEHKQLTDGKTWAAVGRFSPDGRRVLFMSGEVKEETPAEKKARDEVGARRPRQHNKLTVVEIASGKTTAVADIPLNADLQGFCWAPDGKRIAYVWREVHEGDPKEAQDKETQSHLVTCDPDGKNQKTLLSETGKGQYEITLEGVDWR
jgi:RNA polymerase sigma factor (sigma-70 family)